MFYLIYKITNNINNKIYIGSHKTKNKDDGYIGSGKYLNRAIKKYGIENFTKEILFVFDNATEMYNKEAELVDDNFLSEENTYNLKRGGFGGWDYVNSNNLSGGNGRFNKVTAKERSILAHKKLQEIRKNNPQWQADHNKKTSLAMLGHPNYFKYHSEESKKKISTTLRENNTRVGEKNSQYGTLWITNGVENKKIKKEFLDDYIKLGYYKGRKY